MAALAVVVVAHAASAAAPAPVPALVLNDGVTQLYSAPASEFQSSENLTWRLSPDDPDQVNGVLNYTLYQDQTTFPTGWLPTWNVSHTPIPNRPGWVYTDASRIDFSTNGSFVIHYNMTATNDSASEPRTSLTSCLLTVDAYLSNQHDQCGSPVIAAPAGMSALVTQAQNATTNGLVDLRWFVSANDTNLTVGNFSYEVLWMSTALQAVTGNFTSSGLDPTGADDANGVRYFLWNVSAGDTQQVQFKIHAIDPRTHQWANDSCVVGVNVEHITESSTCGAFAAAGGIDASGPTFPLINVPDQASRLGLSPVVLALFLGAVAVMIGAVGGFAVAQVPGGVAGGVLGVVAAIVMHDWPDWSIVVFFMAAAAVVVLYFARRGD